MNVITRMFNNHDIHYFVMKYVLSWSSEPLTTARYEQHHASDYFHITARLAHLFRGKDWDEILVCLTNFLLNHSLIGLLFELLAGQPEHHVLLAELCPQELPETAAPRCTFHHLFKRRGPGAGIFQSRPQTCRSRNSRYMLFLLYWNVKTWCLVIKPLPFFTVVGSLCPALTAGPLYCLILTPNSQTGGKNTLGVLVLSRTDPK